MRGKEVRVNNKYENARITPAYAGKSFLSTSRAFCNQDHPRLCGEKFDERIDQRKFIGSPPPMRGKGRSTAFVERSRGITPAYAGKRKMEELGVKTYEDHPRLCGEKNRHLWRLLPPLGSPPPMRGKESDMTGNLPESRITPAYAGKRP